MDVVPKADIHQCSSVLMANTQSRAPACIRILNCCIAPSASLKGSEKVRQKIEGCSVQLNHALVDDFYQMLQTKRVGLSGFENHSFFILFQMVSG